jgi:hypothetical protein
MKILLVGSNFNSAIERYYLRYLEQLGASVSLYPAPDIVFNYHSKNLLNKTLFKTGLNKGYKPVNRELLKKVAEFNPDFIWIFKGMEIYPETLGFLKRDFRLANYNPDHPFVITSKGSGNNNVTRSVGLYDLHFCYHTGLKKQIEDVYNLPAVFLPFAYDTEDLANGEIDEGDEEILRVCFQGNGDIFRAEKIKKLTDAGIPVDIYGVFWDKTSVMKNPLVKVFGIAPRPLFWKLNRQYRIQLNLFREYNNGSHNMRTFEIPAAGGIQLAPYSREQELFFEAGKEIFFFRNDEEMIQQAKDIIGMSKSGALEIREAARRRSVGSDYTFRNRAQTVFKTFENFPGRVRQ